MQTETGKLYSILNDCAEAGKRLQVRAASLKQRAKHAEQLNKPEKALAFRTRATDQLYAYKALKSVMVDARNVRPITSKDIDGLELVIAALTDTQDRLTDWAQEGILPSEERERAIRRTKQDIRSIQDLIAFVGGKPHPRQGVSEQVPAQEHEGPGEVHTDQNVTELAPVPATPEAFGIALEPFEFDEDEGTEAP